MSDTQFIDGLIVKAPNAKAPEYVKARMSIKREELIAWLQSQRGEWINADIKESRQGKWYCQIDPWKPEGKPDAPKRQAPRGGGGQSPPSRDEFVEDGDIPFISPFGTF